MRFNPLPKDHTTSPSEHPAQVEISRYIFDQIERLSQDWDYDQPVTLESRLFGELGMESLDAVVLATSLQEHFGKQMPFAELFAEIGEKQCDLSVGELIAFVQRSIEENRRTL